MSNHIVLEYRIIAIWHAITEWEEDNPTQVLVHGHEEERYLMLFEIYKAMFFETSMPDFETETSDWDAWMLDVIISFFGEYAYNNITSIIKQKDKPDILALVQDIVDTDTFPTGYYLYREIKMFREFIQDD